MKLITILDVAEKVSAYLNQLNPENKIAHQDFAARLILVMEQHINDLDSEELTSYIIKELSAKYRLIAGELASVSFLTLLAELETRLESEVQKVQTHDSSKHH